MPLVRYQFPLGCVCRKLTTPSCRIPQGVTSPRSLRPTADGIVDLLCKFKSCFATSFSRFTPRHSQLVAMLGAARTRCTQTSCHLLPSIARLLIVPPNAALPPLAGNYLFKRTMVISKRNRHR